MDVSDNFFKFHPFGASAGVEVVLSLASPEFNLGLNVGDSIDEVMGRRARVAEYLGCGVAYANQVHGSEVIVDPKPNGYQAVGDADAMVASSSSVALAILTADCLPVVFCATGAQGAMVVGVAHAGWRGLCEGVLSNTLTSIKNVCPTVDSIKAWLGPCIGPTSFEVGNEVKRAFMKNFGEVEGAFVPATLERGKAFGDKDNALVQKWLADLQCLARHQLASAYVEVVGCLSDDTFTDRRWYSHRAWQRGLAPAGRFATVVRLAPQPL